jgi:hypothetical protein
MFGLNDSKTQLQDIPPAAPFPQAMPGSNSDPLPPPPLNQDAPQPLQPAGGSPIADPSHATSIHSSGVALPGSDELAKSSVNLENAFIPSHPPQMEQKVAAEPLPTAASLITTAPSDDLLKIKQQALTSLAPLVDHLEQTPEEKFKTTMMLIQASDNAELIPEAYDAANKISDGKVRAQALLDVVNEINYFTQHGINVPGQKPAGT